MLINTAGFRACRGLAGTETLSPRRECPDRDHLTFCSKHCTDVLQVAGIKAVAAAGPKAATPIGPCWTILCFYWTRLLSRFWNSDDCTAHVSLLLSWRLEGLPCWGGVCWLPHPALIAEVVAMHRSATWKCLLLGVVNMKYIRLLSGCWGVRLEVFFEVFLWLLRSPVKVFVKLIFSLQFYLKCQNRDSIVLSFQV